MSRRTILVDPRLRCTAASTTAAVWCTSGTRSKPCRRATSSIRSSSIAMSNRQAGGVTLQASDARRTRHAQGSRGDCRISASAIVGADHRPRTRRSQTHRGAPAAARPRAPRPRADPATPPAQLEDQPRRALERALLQRRIDAALEALRGIGHEPVATPAAGDGIRHETSDFEQHVGGRSRRCPSGRRP